ncbi:MAG: hypothetical protein HY646_05070, partial [Acidobacteria bacterium]|nr:hypothetical protein [Acidobacteriota bacterium]
MKMVPVKRSLALLILFALPLHAQDTNQAEGKDGKNSGFRFVFNNRPSFRFGKVVRIDLRVKSQGDFRAFSPDLSTDEGEFDFQRMRIGVEGNILEELEYQVEHEFREYFWDGRTSKDRWRDVFVNFRYFR